MNSIISPFEYVTVLIAIILGMGITKVVSGLTSLIQHRGRVKIYWPHLLLIILVLIIHIQEWWDTYGMISYKWHLPVFLFIILYPINLYVLARILFPTSFRTKVIDLKVFYYENFRVIFLVGIILDSLAIIDNTFIAQVAWKDQILQVLVFFAMLFILVSNTKNESIHKIVSLLLLSIVVVFMIATWNIYMI